MYPSSRFAVSLILFLITGLIFAISTANLIVFYYGKNTYKEPYQVRKQKTAIVLGGKIENNRPSTMLKDRLDTALELYDKQKVKKLLVTGTVMKSYLMANGVAENDIVTDNKSHSTYDTIYRARKVFGIKKAIIISQEFHLKRALFTAKVLNIKAQGLIADKHQYGNKSYILVFREYFANVQLVSVSAFQLVS